MFSLTYFKLVFDRRVMPSDHWHSILEDAIIPALRDLDANKDGVITIREVLATVKRVILTSLT